MPCTSRSVRSVLLLFLPSLMLLSAGCVSRRPPPPAAGTGAVTVKILATTDVHGWLNGNVDKNAGRYEGGLAEIAAVWRADEGYDPRRPEFLVLDSGDMWTGPAESTLPKGKPLVDAFNALGYDAAAVGNHEFDFGLETLRENSRALEAPMLAANLESSAGGPAVDFCERSRLVEISGLRVGIIGLACIETPQMSFPSTVAGLVFGDYEAAVRDEARRLQEKGATALVVIAHDGLEKLKPVAERTADLPIRLFLGGHNHRRELEVLERDPSTPGDDVILLTAGCFARSYGRVNLTFEKGELVAHSEAIVPVEGPLEARRRPADPVLGPLAERASAAVAAQMDVIVGRAATALESSNESSPLGERVADSWLEAFPQAQVAIVNEGGIRQSLPAGPVSVGAVFGVLPFQNDLVLVRLSGAQLREVLENSSVVLAGARYQWRAAGEKRIVTRAETADGRPLEDGRTYTVITTDFLYEGGDSMPFHKMDAQPTLLGVNWREPFLDLLRRRGEAGLSAPEEARSIQE